jgi:hypothetical protein
LSVNVEFFMAKKKSYSINWEDDKVISFTVNGVAYTSLPDVPNLQDRRRLEMMMNNVPADDDFESEAEPEIDFEAEREKTIREVNQAQNIILWVFGGVAVVMLLVAFFSAWSAISQLAREESAPGTVVEVVARRQYIDQQDDITEEYYYPVVRFTAEDGRRREVQMTEGSNWLEYEAGDAVTVRYNPERPLDARIDSLGSTMLLWILPSITSILGLAFGGAVLVVNRVMK